MKVYALAIAVTAIVLGLRGSPVYAAEAPCKAGTIPEVSQCVDKLNAGTISAIEITGKILCTPASPCRFTITTTSGGIIFGTPSDLPAVSKPGFYRSGSYSGGVYNAPVFKITSAKNLTVANLVFDDNISDANCPFDPATFFTDPTCSDQINVSNSTGIAFKQLYMTNAKKHSIVAEQSNTISLLNSAIAGSFTRGVVMVTVDGAHIEGNYIYDNRAAGLLIEDVKNFVIKNNFLSKNQNRVPWVSRAGGGQINSKSENTLIIGNRITEVAKPETVENYGGSIELHVRNVNVTVKDNDFVNKLADGFVVGPAIYNDPGGAIYTNISIDNNRVDTGVDSTIRSAVYDWMGGNGWVLGTNCFNGSTSCTLPAYGTLSVDPNPCIIEPGKNSCSVTLSWYINFATNMEIKTGATTFANWARGVQRKVDGITETPTPFTIIGDGKTLATVNVSGVTQGTTPPPSKPGDLNADGKVDIYDYNIIVTNFGNPYTIYDYNQLVANFGK